MYPTSQRFLDAIRHPPAIYTRTEVWFGGSRVDSYGADGIPVYGGEADVDPSKQVRRTLSGLKVDNTDEMWNLLSPVGTELRCFRGFRYLNGETEVVPVGRFVVPNLTQAYGGDWSGQIGSASDRMIKVQQARFSSPRAFPAGYPIAQAITDLLSEVLGNVTNLATSTATFSSPQLFEKDRGAAVTQMCASIGADAFIAPDGTPMVVNVRQLSDTSVWTVDPGDDGILYTADRDRNYDRTYSGVVAAPAQIDGSTPFDPVTVWDSDPNSPTYYLGPFGRVPYYFTSPLLANAQQAQLAAMSLLPKVTAVRAQLSLTAECNPALADGDTITVVLPPRGRGGDTVTERHLVGAFTVPLTPDGVQSISTASAVADVADSE